jgi:hypothetical protein
MSDERHLTPEQEAYVARLLADARVEEPLPPEVGARLDQVLAGLAGQPVAGPGHQARAPVIDLAARRRRRVRTLLVAAAAVVVVGVGVGQLVEPRGSDDADNASDAGGGQGDGAAAEERAGPDTTSSEDAPNLSKDQLRSLGEPARIKARSFAESVRRLQDRPGVRSDDSTMMDGSDLAAPEMDFSCGRAPFGAGKLIAVRYRGAPAVLAYRPPAGDTQVVELLQCGSGETMRSTTVPLP